MDGWFEIDSVVPQRLVRLTMGGFFDEDGIVRLRDALLAEVRRLGTGPDEHLTLCDITAMSIQSQDMVGRFAALVGSPGLRSRRLAFITGATLARLQARRLTSREGVAYFADVDAATAWLLDQQARAA